MNNPQIPQRGRREPTYRFDISVPRSLWERIEVLIERERERWPPALAAHVTRSAVGRVLLEMATARFEAQADVSILDPDDDRQDA